MAGLNGTMHIEHSARCLAHSDWHGESFLSDLNTLIIPETGGQVFACGAWVSLTCPVSRLYLMRGTSSRVQQVFGPPCSAGSGEQDSL